MKSEDEVVHDFNEIVNMTADELDAFLKTEGSETTGWSKDDGSGESIGHESGRKIVDILRRNPHKDPSKYTDADKDHMRRVVSYCKRHLAQESHLKETKGPEELEKSKSTRSLKNWGHDPMKTLKGNSKGAAQTDKKEDKVEKKEDKAEKKQDKEDKEDKTPKSKDKKGEKKSDDAEVGDKREAEAESAPAPPKKAAKTSKASKPPSEGTRKPPSRSAKKA